MTRTERARDHGPRRVQVLRGPSRPRPGESQGRRGDDLSLLGPNGAGKTTMVRILSTLIPADSGSMRIAGHDVVTDPDSVRGVIGVTGQFSAVDNLLTGAENLQLMADLRHLGPPSRARGWPSCWSSSSSPMPPTSRCRSTRAGCDDGSTWP